MTLIETEAPDLAPLRPLARETLQDRSYEALRQAVMSGQFKPGQAITLRAAAAALGVSEMPVRGALLRLEAEGALEARGLQRTLTIPDLTPGELTELRDIRMVLEGLAAERAAAAITARELAEVEAHCQAIAAAAEAGDRDAYVLANWAFHTAVYRASRMPKLLSVVEGLWMRVGPHVAAMMPDRDHLIRSMPNHWIVLEALRRGDGPAAKAGIAADIAESAEELERALRG